MNKTKLLLLALNFAFTWGYCHENTNQKKQMQGLEMNYTFEKQKKKFFIGLELKTNNEECSSAMPAHKERFFNENVSAKIPTRN